MTEKTTYDHRFAEILIEALKPINLEFLSKEVIAGVFEQFQLSVHQAEDFGHQIDDKDLAEEFRLLLLGISAYSRKQPLSQRLSEASQGAYQLMFSSFLESLSSFLSAASFRYFEQASEDEISGSKNWYGVHLSNTVTLVFNYLKNLK